MISGVVLAAGEGKRYGSTKQLAIAGGKPLVQHAIDALAGADVEEILVVTGHDADAVESAMLLPAGARVVRNPNFTQGQSTSLAAAFHEVAEDSEATIVLMSDQPGVEPSDVTALIERFRATRKQIVRLRFADGPGPALLSREIYAEAGHLHGDVGARILMASHPEWVEEVQVDRPAPRDVDTLEDLPGDPVAG